MVLMAARKRETLRRMSYTILWEDDGVIWNMTGEVTDEELIGCNDEIHDDPRFENLRYAIADLSEIEKFAASTESVRQVAKADELTSIRNPHLKVAFVVSTLVMKGLSRLYMQEGGSARWDIQIFEDMSSAMEWIDA